MGYRGEAFHGVWPVEQGGCNCCSREDVLIIFTASDKNEFQLMPFLRQKNRHQGCVLDNFQRAKGKQEA
jgi:hypothetical protein